MAFTTINKPEQYFNTLLYTGNASTNAITGVGFAPAFSWFKSRSNINSQIMFDVLRGTNGISPSGNAINYDSASDGFTSLDSDGFTFNGSGGGGGVNASSFTYVGWNWKGGTTSGVSGGTITPINYSYDATAKIAVVAYTGNGTSGATVPHGLGVKPAAMWVKNTSGSVNSWAIYNQAMTATSYLEMDVANGIASNAGRWNNTEPTTSLFSLGDSSTTNESGYNYIAYIFGEVPGFSKFNRFKGNGNADGAFIYTGFAPSMVIIKSEGGSENWHMYDNKRSTFNVRDKTLDPDQTAAEATLSGIDFLSNGFKMRTSATWGNSTSYNITYQAFAERPLVSTNGKAATAV